MAAVDGWSFLSISNSSTLQKYHPIVTGKPLPSSANGIRNAVLKYYLDQKVSVGQELKELANGGKKFSISLDEWTSNAGRRYCNINVHTRESFYNLGLSRIQGSFTSAACLTMVREKLAEFNIDLGTQVIAVVTDGASVMKCFGRLSGRCHQICLAHGIHLAVTDILYKPNRVLPTETGVQPSEESDANQPENTDDINSPEDTDQSDSPEDTNQSDSHEDTDQSDSHEDIDVTDDDEISVELGEALHFVNDDDGNSAEYQENIADVLQRVRKLVKFFEKSTPRKDILEKNSVKPRKLILDIKTRWNSMLSMLQVVLELQDAIQKSFIDLRMPPILSQPDFEVICNLVQVLEPVKLATEALCSRNATSVTADVAVTFMLEKLSSFESNIGRALFDAMKNRMIERRTTLSDVASYLHYHSEDSPINHDYFAKLSRHQLAVKLREIYCMFQIAPSQVSEESETQASESLLLEISMAQELCIALQQAETFKPTRNNQRRDTLSSVKREMQVFEATSTKGPILTFVYDAVFTICPSSVEAERVFSCANNFCTKLRSRLSDKTLNALVYLRWYFRHSKL